MQNTVSPWVPTAAPRAFSSLSPSILASARNAGWLGAHALRPDEVLFGAAVLPLGHQRICVRQLVLEASAPRSRWAGILALLYHEMMVDFFLEEYVIIEGGDDAFLFEVKAFLSRAGIRKFHAGRRSDFDAWLGARLGPVAQLRPGSALRCLAEGLIGLNHRPEPLAFVPLKGGYDAMSIGASMAQGELGTQAVETLLRNVLGESVVTNVEADPAWRAQDVDFLVALDRRTIKVEVKYEKQNTGNLALEIFSSYDHKTPGWLTYSTADILLSGFSYNGDFIVLDMAQAREWVAQNKDSLSMLQGWSKGQTYKSGIYAPSINRVLTELPESFFFQLKDWLPTLAPSKAAVDGKGRPVPESYVSAEHQGKRLRPVRSRW